MKPLCGHSDVEVSIEYCTRSSFHTKHNPEKYADCFNEVKDALFKRFNHIRVRGNPDVPVSGRRAFTLTDCLGPLKDVSKPRLGSFEVMLTHGTTGTKSVFSKLESGRWPNPDGLVRAVERVLSGDSLPPLTPRISARGRLPGDNGLRVQRNPNLKEPRHPRSWVTPRPVQRTRIKDLKELSHRLYKKLAEEGKPEEATEAAEVPNVAFDPLVIPGDDFPVRSVVNPLEEDEPMIQEVASGSAVQKDIPLSKSEASKGVPPKTPEAYEDMNKFEQQAPAQDEAVVWSHQNKVYSAEFEEDDPTTEERGAGANDAARVSDQSNGYDGFESTQEMIAAAAAKAPLREQVEGHSGARKEAMAPQLPRPGEDLPDLQTTTPPVMAENATVADTPARTSETDPKETAQTSAEASDANQAKSVRQEADVSEPVMQDASEGKSALGAGLHVARAVDDEHKSTDATADGPASGPINPEQSSHVQVDGYEDDFAEDADTEPVSPVSPAYEQIHEDQEDLAGGKSVHKDAYSDDGDFENSEAEEDNNADGAGSGEDQYEDAFESEEDVAQKQEDNSAAFEEDEDMDAAAKAVAAGYMNAAGLGEEESGDFDDDAMEEMDNSDKSME